VTGLLDRSAVPYPLVGVAVGTGVAPSPRADPYVRNYRIRLLLRVLGVGAVLRVIVPDLGRGDKAIGGRTDTIRRQVIRRGRWLVGRVPY
jgi:hypothetical protein